VPLRYAFSLTLAFQSLELMGQEWLTILEAQRSRGAWSPPKGWRDLPAQMRDWVALTVPTVVLTAKRAWTVTEAAYARGLDSPQRRPFRSLRAGGRDWLLLVGSVALLAAVWLLGR